jgi:hypothetical protein
MILYDIVRSRRLQSIISERDARRRDATQRNEFSPLFFRFVQTS